MVNMYVKIGSEYVEVSSFLVGQNIKPITKTLINDAISTYLKLCTKTKCENNQKSEIKHFEKISNFFKMKNLTYVDEIKFIHIQEYELILSQFMVASSVNRRFHTFNNFFSMCLKWQFITENPCAEREDLQEIENRRIPWPYEIYSKFIQTTSGVYTHIFEFLWLTGARPIELRNLKWTDINVNLKKVTLRSGKNAQTTRLIDLTDELRNLFGRIYYDSEFVFSLNQKHIRADSLSYYCKDRMKHITYINYTPYGLRHAFGTRLSIVGGNAFDIADMMGHSNIETSQTYIHITAKHRVELLKKISTTQNYLM